MKKLILNKKVIAQLTNPSRTFGGEGYGVTATAGASCQTCPPLKTCVIKDPTNPAGPFCDDTITNG